ncbi:MAG: glycoside hydrolase family 16 protein [Balneolaceae bacterium]|nr:MAG: glycoside hydrolase family 16 protein [Balneolaceae bacterium]
MLFIFHIRPLLFLLLFAFVSCSEDLSLGGEVSNGTPELPEPGEKEWVLVWQDEFDGDVLDPEKWSYQYGTGREEGLTGWGNNELQYYTDREENVRVEGGMLHITAHEELYEGMQYTSARIRTINKGDWTYGRIEARAKMPQGQGIWPAIWMLPTRDNPVWPRDGEIDIMELVGHEPATVHGTVHFGTDWQNHEWRGGEYTLDEGIFADDFHVFAIEWKMNEIQFFVNDTHYFTVTPSTTAGYQYPFNNPFHLILNLAVGGNWPGSPDATTEFPQSMIVDYVRVYQWE